MEQIGNGPGLSFFCLRMVDIALKKRNKADALKYSAQAIDYTPTLPAARAARVRALIADGNYDKALSELQAIEELGRKRNRVRDGLEKLVLYQVRFEYNLQRKRFDLCKSDVDNMARLDAAQAKAMKMDIVNSVTRSGTKIDVALANWLKT